MLQKGRAAWVIGVIFVGTGIVYYAANHNTTGWDPAGAVLLILAGVAMTFAFLVLLRGSRNL